MRREKKERRTYTDSFGSTEALGSTAEAPTPASPTEASTRLPATEASSRSSLPSWPFEAVVFYRNGIIYWCWFCRDLEKLLTVGTSLRAGGYIDYCRETRIWWRSNCLPWLWGHTTRLFCGPGVVIASTRWWSELQVVNESRKAKTYTDRSRLPDGFPPTWLPIRSFDGASFYTHGVEYRYWFFSIFGALTCLKPDEMEWTIVNYCRMKCHGYPITYRVFRGTPRGVFADLVLLSLARDDGFRSKSWWSWVEKHKNLRRQLSFTGLQVRPWTLLILKSPDL